MAVCFQGLVYMPEMESTQASINITMPEGATLEETGNMSDEIMERLSDLPDVESIGAMAGSDSGMALLGMGGGSDTETATMYLTLREDMELSNDELVDEILSRTEDLNCEVDVSASSMDMSALGAAGSVWRSREKIWTGCRPWRPRWPGWWNRFRGQRKSPTDWKSLPRRRES